jgi:hypothetical protein
MIGFHTHTEHVGTRPQSVPSDVRLSIEVVAVIAAFMMVAVGLALTANIF